jgi:hypothetical protein
MFEVADTQALAIDGKIRLRLQQAGVSVPDR